MNHVNLLDCTLRDGAYLVDKKFGDKTIRGIIEGLVKAKTDFIEIGFLQDEGFGEGKTVFLNSADAKRFIPKDKGGCQFTVLADYSRYSVNNLDEYDPESIDAVRECFFKNERFQAIEVCKEIKKRGYKLFVQPVDILGYSDKELIEFLELVNTVEPYCLSIVDTFGSMYQEDLHRVFEIINHNLVSSCKLGFHSHNNMQLSNALSQEFIRMTVGKRNIIVDGTISGMGRGAGNTPTELIAQYMVSQLGASYDIDALLDIIDTYMDSIRTRCSWGYSTQYFLAGCYSAHVNNIAYLSNKNSIRSKDIRYILNKIGAISRKRYDYDLLEKTYLELLSSDIDDSAELKKLGTKIAGKNVLLILPGNTSVTETEKIDAYITEKQPVIISVNFIHDKYTPDFLYMSNVKRFRFWKNSEKFRTVSKIITSNIMVEGNDETTHIVSFNKLIKCGWEKMDNSGIMVLRLLDLLRAGSIAIAGFDGYKMEGQGGSNYASTELELSSVREDAKEINQEIQDMLCDFNNTKNSDLKVEFITSSRFENCFE